MCLKRPRRRVHNPMRQPKPHRYAVDIFISQLLHANSEEMSQKSQCRPSAATSNYVGAVLNSPPFYAVRIRTVNDYAWHEYSQRMWLRLPAWRDRSSHPTAIGLRAIA